MRPAFYVAFALVALLGVMILSRLGIGLLLVSVFLLAVALLAALVRIVTS